MENTKQDPMKEELIRSIRTMIEKLTFKDLTTIFVMVRCMLRDTQK